MTGRWWWLAAFGEATRRETPAALVLYLAPVLILVPLRLALGRPVPPVLWLAVMVPWWALWLGWCLYWRRRNER